MLIGEGRGRATRPRMRSGPLMVALCVLSAFAVLAPTVAGGVGDARAVPARSADQLLDR